jgi:hypothetical protein
MSVIWRGSGDCALLRATKVHRTTNSVQSLRQIIRKTTPQGPDAPFDPSEPKEKKKTHRGGSFLCTDQYCSRYVVGTRGKGEVSTGTNHLGFRTVKPGSESTPPESVQPRK